MIQAVKQAQLEALGEGRFRVSGVLDASTVTRVLSQSGALFRGLPHVKLDLAAVSASDSSGLALLLEWLRLARVSDQRIQLDNIPEQIMALARISEVEALLMQNGNSNSAHGTAKTPNTATSD